MNHTRTLSGLAGVVMAAALIVGISTPASAAIKPDWTGTKTCVGGYPVVIVNARGGTVDLNYGRRGDEFTIKSSVNDQRFQSAAHTVTWTVHSWSLTKNPRVTCSTAIGPIPV